MKSSTIKNGVKVRNIKNKPEHDFINEMLGKGWAPTKCGWPDFFCVHDDGRICVVEVKKTPDMPFKREQKVILDALSLCGIECFRWDPITGLEKYPIDIPKEFNERG